MQQIITMSKLPISDVWQVNIITIRFYMRNNHNFLQVRQSCAKKMNAMQKYNLRIHIIYN